MKRLNALSTSFFPQRPFGLLGSFLVALFALCILSPESSAQSAAGKIVREIDVRYIGAETVSESRILANMATKIGDTLTQENLENDIKNLYESGDVDDVRITTDAVPGGVRLVVTVAARALLGDILFEGNAGLSDRKLRGATDLKVGRSFDDIELQLAREEIEALYQKKGYGDATVSYNVVETPEGFSNVVFTVDEGAKTLLDDILFEGNTVFTDRVLRKQLQVKEKSLWRLFIGGGKLDTELLAQDVEALQVYYGDAGYIDAIVDYETVPTKKDKVNLVFRITEGQKYEVASVKLDGLSVFTNEELEPALVTLPGQAYSVTNIRTDERTLRDFYGAKGYADVRINTRIDRAEDSQLAVGYYITEGEKSYIRKIDISGNQKTKDKVIRREIAVDPGDEYNLVKVDASRKRLGSLQYFDQIDVFPSETGDPGFKDLKVEVSERSTGSVNFGAGFSSIDNLVGFAELTQSNFDLFNWPNFTGGGQNFQARVQLGTERRDISLRLYEPYLNDERLGLGGELYFRDLLFLSNDYDQTNIGGRIYLRKPLGQFGYIQPEYRLQQVEISVDDDASEELLSEEGDFLQSRLGLTWVYDRRDSNQITRSGYRLEMGGSFSGEFLGGDVDIYAFELGGAKYFSLPFDTILILRGELNTVDSVGDGEVPIFERVFLGGAQNLRGFDFREAGPQDENGEPLGGKTSVFGSIEYTFPIVNRVRGALFYDIGAVSRDAWDIGGDINSDYGVGLRLFLGQFPINLDYGIPLQKDEFNDGSGGKFNFTLGFQY